jgi:hypothetical protein
MKNQHGGGQHAMNRMGPKKQFDAHHPDHMPLTVTFQAGGLLCGHAAICKPLP